ncbi:hypothetical protein [Thauera butanivorans]|nr:hypothetical protein [Thauera butanivorans]
MSDATSTATFTFAKCEFDDEFRARVMHADGDGGIPHPLAARRASRP